MPDWYTHMLKMEPIPDWCLRPETPGKWLEWSFGVVKDVPGLYDPRIFGPKSNLACECGEYTGEDAAGTLCGQCGVSVYADAASARRLRMGYTNLPLPCPHPFDSDLLVLTWPVAPVGYRQSADGSPNEMGLRYEALMAAIDGFSQILPATDAPDYYEELARLRPSPEPIVAAIEDIVRVKDMHDPAAGCDGLGRLLLQALASMDRFTCSLIRSCGLELQLNVAI